MSKLALHFEPESALLITDGNTDILECFGPGCNRYRLEWIRVYPDTPVRQPWHMMDMWDTLNDADLTLAISSLLKHLFPSHATIPVTFSAQGFSRTAQAQRVIREFRKQLHPP